MDRDTTTRTGARTPGVGREPERWHWLRIIPRLRTGSGCYSVAMRRMDANRQSNRVCREQASAGACEGKVPSDIPALKPYSGKPAVRNFRGGGGNNGIIRRPFSASILLDSGRCEGKAPSDLPALKPYSGKPTVRNFREGNGKQRHHSKPVQRLCPTRLHTRQGAVLAERQGCPR
jgi:hypothetical protein